MTETREQPPTIGAASDRTQSEAPAGASGECGSAWVSTTMTPASARAKAVRTLYGQDAPSFDPIDGPTHQPGIAPGRHYQPLRTPFGEVGVAGAGLERNVTDLDLVKNRHRPGEHFGA
jgi:hypothetical protein